jgi:hypothetical protein
MKSTTPTLDPTPALARQVIDLYANDLSDVRFPDLDLEALQHAQAELHGAQVELERIEALLAQAREQVDARSQQLMAKAERGLSYARVFAQGDPELAPRVAEIGRKKGAGSQPEAAAAGAETHAPTRRRGRPPKNEAPSELFNQAETDEAHEANGAHAPTHHLDA